MKRHTFFSSLASVCLTVATAVILDAQLHAPRVGVVRYGDGTVHPIFGLPSNYVVGTPVLQPADAVSFSDAGGLMAKDGTIALLDPSSHVLAEYVSAERAPILNIDDDLPSAIAWLPEQGTLLTWSGTALLPTKVNAAASLANVSGLRLEGSHIVKLLLTDPRGAVAEATVSLPSGELISLNALPGVHGPAFYAESYAKTAIVFHDERGLEIATPAGIVSTLALTSSDLTVERMSSSSLHLTSRSSQGSWVLHLDRGAASLAVLPVPPVMASPSSVHVAAAPAGEAR